MLDEKTGERILNKDITLDPLRARAYAYCCDTAFNPEMAAQIKGVDLLYHDCTFDAAGEQRPDERVQHPDRRQRARRPIGRHRCRVSRADAVSAHRSPERGPYVHRRLPPGTAKSTSPAAAMPLRRPG